MNLARAIGILLVLLVLAAAAAVLTKRQAVTPPPPVTAIEADPVEAAPPEPQPSASPAAPPPPMLSAIEWKLIDERPFNGRMAFNSYHPFYVIEAGTVGQHNPSAEIQWNHYSDEPLVTYRPDKELLLDTSRVFDRWVRLAKQTPHTVKWEIVFHGGAACARLDAGGVTFTKAVEDDSLPLQSGGSHTLVLERSGKTLALRAGEKSASVAVDEADRTPLRIAAQITPMLLESTRLYFGNGEQLSPPPAETGERKPPHWTKVFAEDFAKEESLKAFSVCPETSQFEWKKAESALAMGPAASGTPDYAYVLLHKSLPGDVRIRFRARSTRPGQPAFFGLLLSLAGRLKKEDAYFVEWNYWQVQIKKKNTRLAGQEIGYPREDANGWLGFMVEKTGGAFKMYTEGQEVLAYRDPHPLNDSEHDLLAFYSWCVPMEFKDLVIERNQDDPVPARDDDPATPENYLQGNRTAPSAEAPVPIEF